jgi:3-hydroxybutyryl-CoA dehydrogenase
MKVYARWSEVRKVGVIGAGTMGNGIAQVFAQSGYEVRSIDAVQSALDRARSTIDNSLAKFVEKGKLTAEHRDEALGRLSAATDISRLAEVDFVVEAIIEDASAKRDLFGQLDALTQSDVILSSNTSSISSPTLARRRGVATECVLRAVLR